MSVLMEALNKAEKMFERKQSDFDQTTDSSSNEIDENLFLAEITDNETPKNTLPLMEDSTIKERNEASLKDFKEIESQQPLPDSDQSIEQPLSLIDWQAPLENNETNTNSTSPMWDDEFLPQFQNAIQEDNDKVDSTTAEPIHQDLSDFQEEIQEDNDKVDSTTAEPIHQDFRDLSDFDNEQPLIDFKNEARDIESTLADNLKQSCTTATADSPQLKTATTALVTQTQPEFELDEKNTEATQTEQSLFLDEIDEIFSATATVDTKQLPTATTAAQEEKTLTQTQPDFDFKLEEKKSEETQTEQNFFLDETVPHPEAARRILAASAAPQTPVSKRPLLLLTGVLTVLLVSMGTGYYYYSQSSLAEPFSFQRHQLTSTSISPPVEKTGETEQASSAQNPPRQSSSTSAAFEATHKPVDEPNQVAAITVIEPVKIAQPAQSENTAKKSLTQTQSKVIQAKAAKQPNTDQKPLTAHQSFIQAITKREQTLLKSPQQSTNHLKDLKPKKRLKPQPQQPKVKTPGIHTLRKNKVIQSINQALSTGYDAFQRGDDSTALRSYLNALRQEQNNRDALFGLAALALRSGNRPQAQHYYRRVLQLYPQDRHAQVGLINSLDNHATSSESQLKEQAPQSAHIHFSLGHFYATQGRWAQAQSAYFNAYRYDKKQADYAYNLAVSLDQLNQPSAALAYYQRALQQIQNQAIHFNPETVRQRMQTIKQHTQPSALEQM